METLSHNDQWCSVVQLRSHQHDMLVDFTLAKLTNINYQTKEPTIPTRAGCRKPDVITWHDQKEAWMLDAQVVTDTLAGDLTQAHQRKVAYYATNDDIVTYVTRLMGHPPAFAILTTS